MVHGEQVAVKVIHPHVKDTLKTDMSYQRSLLAFWTLFLRWSY